MTNQKPISARVNHETLRRLEEEAYVSGINKNRILNEALNLYIWVQDLRRSYAAIGKKTDLPTLLDRHRATAPVGIRWMADEFCDM